MKTVLTLICALITTQALAVSAHRLIHLAGKSGIDLSQHADAMNELKEHVTACGTGVVEGWPGDNRCEHQIALDAMFLKPMKEKTGLIPDHDFAQRAGVEFLELIHKEPQPDAWDLKDIGPMTDIHTQRCADCWSTSSRKLLEQALATHGYTEPNGELIKLSAQTTLSSCCTWCGSCNGGSMATPNFFSQENYGYGLPRRPLDPYRGTNTYCRFSPSELRSFEHKLIKSPYVGSSLDQSRFFKASERVGPKVENTMALMRKFKSNALVTIQYISQSGGVITSCSAINSYGNHMQNIVGWYKRNGMTIARVQNSVGTGHGQGGYTHIRWECGDRQLNRGLGYQTRVAIIDAPDVCQNVASAKTGPDQTFDAKRSESIVLGQASRSEQTCEWFPKQGIVEKVSADGCQIRVSPKVTTEYHMVATEHRCGTRASSMVLVEAAQQSRKLRGRILTPHGLTPEAR